jgi:hypothetical protein
LNKEQIAAIRIGESVGGHSPGGGMGSNPLPEEYRIEGGPEGVKITAHKNAAGEWHFGASGRRANKVAENGPTTKESYQSKEELLEAIREYCSFWY